MSIPTGAHLPTVQPGHMAAQDRMIADQGDYECDSSVPFEALPDASAILQSER